MVGFCLKVLILDSLGRLDFVTNAPTRPLPKASFVLLRPRITFLCINNRRWCIDENSISLSNRMSYDQPRHFLRVLTPAEEILQFVNGTLAALIERVAAVFVERPESLESTLAGRRLRLAISERCGGGGNPSRRLRGTRPVAGYFIGKLGNIVLFRTLGLSSSKATSNARNYLVVVPRYQRCQYHQRRISPDGPLADLIRQLRFRLLRPDLELLCHDTDNEQRRAKDDHSTSYEVVQRRKYSDKAFLDCY